MLHLALLSFRLLVPLACLLAGGCAPYTKLAADVASVTVRASEPVRAPAALARALCDRTAVYSYLEQRLGLLPVEPTTPADFAGWYEREIATPETPSAALTWRAYCAELDETGAVYHAGVLMLRAYGEALSGLSGRSALDASGLDDLASGAASTADTFSAPRGLTSSARTVGSILPMLASVLADQVREARLQQLVQDAEPHLTLLISALEAYLHALEGQEAVLAQRRSHVLKALARARDVGGGLSPVADGAQAIDHAWGGPTYRLRTNRMLARSLDLLGRIRVTNSLLARSARNEGHADETRAQAGQLSAALHALADERPEEP